MLVAALVALPALIGAPQAVADPEDHVPPYCSGDQTPPMNSNCQDPPEQGGYMSGSPGANPDTPLGLNPGVEPVI